MSISLLIVGAVAAAHGGLMVYVSLQPDERWGSWWLRAIALISGGGWLGTGACFMAADLSSGGTRTALLISGGIIGVSAQAGRWFVRSRWISKQAAGGSTA